MTTYIDASNYTCSSCGKVYIPYEKDFLCPWCGNQSTEFFDLIPKLVDSLIFNKKEYNTFEHPLWYVKTHSDEIQDILFHVFDLVVEEMQIIQTDPDQQLHNVLDEAFKNRREEKYANYLKDIIFKTYKMYKENTTHT